MSLIENKWQPFVSVAQITWPDTLPFRIEGMYPDGSLLKWMVRSREFIANLDTKKLVSIRIYDVQDPELALIRNLIATHMPPNEGYKPKGIREGLLDDDPMTSVVRGIVRAYGMIKAPAQKVDVNLPEWIKGALPHIYHREISNWLNDHDNENYLLRNDSLERRLGNGLLAVRNFPGGGRRVIVPSGHSVAYTTAQKIYWRIREAGTLMEYGRDLRIMVGELVGKTRQMVQRRAVFHAGKNVITIGCQNVPFRALIELAGREGWSKSASTII